MASGGARNVKNDPYEEARKIFTEVIDETRLRNVIEKTYEAAVAEKPAKWANELILQYRLGRPSVAEINPNITSGPSAEETRQLGQVLLKALREGRPAGEIIEGEARYVDEDAD